MKRCVPWLLLAACGRLPELPQGELAADGQRSEIARVTFNRWTDFITLQVGLDQDCDLLFPVQANDSTAWPPLQVTWVIYDDPRHVVDGTEVVDTFFHGDRLVAHDFEPIDDIDPKGFKFLPPSQRMFLDIEHLEVLSDSELKLDALFGRPMRARIFVEGVRRDGVCAVQTTWCPSEGACDPAPLSSVHVELGAFNTVREVTFHP